VSTRRRKWAGIRILGISGFVADNAEEAIEPRVWASAPGCSCPDYVASSLTPAELITPGDGRNGTNGHQFLVETVARALSRSEMRFVDVT
jgi:hypothetical protein